MLRSGLLTWCLVGALLAGCSRGDAEGGSETAALDAEQATLVAALAANEDGSDEAWTSASGSEPFLVESCGFELIAQRVMERFDTDSNGALESDELTALSDELGDPAERLDLLLSLYDADGSGELEATELATIQADLEARCEVRRERLLDNFDADGDGTLSDTELAAARDALRERFARRHAARVDEFDGNGDGQLGPLERRRAGASIRQRVAGRRAAIADRFDVNQDGELDESERDALDEHLRDCVRGERPLAPVDETPAADAGAP
jgi:Ca2+-binding EF-hand superfamily protein